MERCFLSTNPNPKDEIGINGTGGEIQPYTSLASGLIKNGR